MQCGRPIIMIKSDAHCKSTHESKHDVIRRLYSKLLFKDTCYIMIFNEKSFRVADLFFRNSSQLLT